MVAVCDSCYIILYHSMLMWWPSVISVITLHVDMVAVRNLRRTDVVAVCYPDCHLIVW